MEKGFVTNLDRKEGLILLPQTAMRTWGIQSTKVFFYQLEYLERYPRDHEIKSGVYHLNKLILEHGNHQVSKVYQKNERLEFKSRGNILVDCHIVNLKSHYSNLDDLQIREIIDYSNLGHKYASYKDFIYLSQFLRAILRIIKFKKKTRVKVLWNWRMEWEVNAPAISSILWENKFLNNDLIKSKSKSFMVKYIHNFPEFRGISLDAKLLVILPHTYESFETFLISLQNLFSSNNSAYLKFLEAEFILIKNHRVSNNNYPIEFFLQGKKIIVANSDLLKILPVEIILFSFKNCVIFSTLSSALFVGDFKDTFAFGSVDSKDLKDYGFMLRKARRLSSNLVFAQKKNKS